MSGQNLPPLTWLRAFEAAARHLSFTLAAKELNLTQSAISQHVRSLESWLGLDLFQRRGRALTLTEAGANYVPVIREAFSTLARGTRAFAGSDRGRTLRVLCNITFATWWLTPRIGRLITAAPWLTLNIQTTIWEPDQRPGNSDIEIRFGRSEDMSPTARLIMEETITPVCTPDFAGGTPDWRRHPLFDCAGVMSNWDAWLQSQGHELPARQKVNLASTYVLSLTAALTGQGLALAHGFMIDGIRRVAPLHVPWPHRLKLIEAYFLLPPASHAETPATRAFSDWVEAEIAADRAGNV